MEKKGKVLTSKELLEKCNGVKRAGDLTIVDVLLSPSSIRQEAIKGHLEYLKQGCLNNCLGSDVKGGVI